MLNYKSHFAFFAFLLTFIIASSGWAGGNDLQIPDPFFDQDDFKQFSREAGIALSYAPLAPAEPLGITGFDIGLEVTAANISDEAGYWKKLFVDGNPPNYLPIPKLHIQKGLPFNVDLGLIYSQIPDSNIALIGGEVKWALLEGSTVTPAAAIRANYTRLLGVSDIDLETYGVDVSVSKGFAFLTPYAGLGQVWIRTQENSNLVTLENENLNETKGFVGVKTTFLLFSLVAEAAYANISTYSLRANVSF
ncbi:MAG TPA: hypothetical protein VGB26_02595 [Nitrospiria bacterium]|jgi:hypothetical protein